VFSHGAKRKRQSLRAGEAESTRHVLAKMELSISRLETELHRSCSSWRVEATLCFIRESTVGYTAFLLPSKHGSSLMFSNPADLVLYHGFSFYTLPREDGEANGQEVHSRLGCGMTYTLSKENLSNEFRLDYMPSRIDWVVRVWITSTC
jgi:hypothetical protein